MIRTKLICIENVSIVVKLATYSIFSKVFTLSLIKVSQISHAPNWTCMARPERPNPTPGLRLIS